MNFSVSDTSETIVIVPIIRIVVIAIRHTIVIVVIVPRTPAQRTHFARLHYDKNKKNFDRFAVFLKEKK